VDDMRVQWFMSEGKPYVCATADTRNMCQRLAFEIAAELRSDLVVAPFQEKGPDMWSQCFCLHGLDCDVVSAAIAAGIRFACGVARGNALTPVEGVSIDLIEETKPHDPSC
jgi:hypothetical protein